MSVSLLGTARRDLYGTFHGVREKRAEKSTWMHHNAIGMTQREKEGLHCGRSGYDRWVIALASCVQGGLIQ